MAKRTNISRGAQGWTVRMVRDGIEHSRYFRFSDGGIRKSLAAATRWRDQLVKEVGVRRWKSGPRKKAANNSSGITGVSRNKYSRWVATWQEQRVQRFKTFATKREAIAHRKEQLAQQSE